MLTFILCPLKVLMKLTIEILMHLLIAYGPSAVYQTRTDFLSVVSVVLGLSPVGINGVWLDPIVKPVKFSSIH